MLKRFVFTLFLVGSMAAVAMAAAPQTMNYQGLLTTGGSPVANGVYSVAFTIYTAGVGGTSKWTETQNVSTVSGLFTVVLGTINPLRDTVFNNTARWLGMAVNGDPEMTPRIALSTVPYAARLATVDGSSGGTVSSDVTVDGVVAANSGATAVIEMDGGTNITRNFGSDGLGENWRLWGGTFGQLLLHTSGVGNLTMVEVSAQPSGGEIELHNSVGADYIKLDGGVTGDNSALLPVDAVNSDEMLDEAGLASNSSALDGISSASTIALRSITCPAAGYVLAIGTGTTEIIHNNGAFSSATVWLADSTGFSVSEEVSDFRMSSNAPSGNYYAPYAVQEVFPVSAGLKTLYLRGASNVTANAHDSKLTLLYFPTAYGTIAASAEQSAEEERAEAKSFEFDRLHREIALQQARLAELAKQVEELQAEAPASADQ